MRDRPVRPCRQGRGVPQRRPVQDGVHCRRESGQTPNGYRHDRVNPLLDHAQLHQHDPGRPHAPHPGAQPSRGKRCQASGEAAVSTINRDRTTTCQPSELQLSLPHQGGSLRSPRAARPPAEPALLSPPRSSPAGARAALKACSRLMRKKSYVVAGAVGSTALRSHFGASLEDHGPNVVLYRAGPQTARRAGSLRGHDHSRQSRSADLVVHPFDGKSQHQDNVSASA